MQITKENSGLLIAHASGLVVLAGHNCQPLALWSPPEPGLVFTTSARLGSADARALKAFLARFTLAQHQRISQDSLKTLLGSL